MAVITIDTSNVDDDVVEELSVFLMEVFSGELADGVSMEELLMAVGTVVTEMTRTGAQSMH